MADSDRAAGRGIHYRPADDKRQCCRKCLRSAVPAVTLTFRGGAGRLHWCADHADDADAYRAAADR